MYTYNRIRIEEEECELCVGESCDGRWEKEETIRIRSWSCRDWNSSRCKKQEATVALIFILRTSFFVLYFQPHRSCRLGGGPHAFSDENFCQGKRLYFFSVTCLEFAHFTVFLFHHSFLQISSNNRLWYIYKQFDVWWYT